MVGGYHNNLRKVETPALNHLTAPASAFCLIGLRLLRLCSLLLGWFTVGCHCTFVTWDTAPFCQFLFVSQAFSYVFKHLFHFLVFFGDYKYAGIGIFFFPLTSTAAFFPAQASLTCPQVFSLCFVSSMVFNSLIFFLFIIFRGLLFLIMCMCEYVRECGCPNPEVLNFPWSWRYRWL